MTTRAPPFARLKAVAAPRPDADPVITTHNPSLPSLDICIPFFDYAAGNPRSSTTAGKLGTSWTKSTARNNRAGSPTMTRPRVTLRTSALVIAGAFPHHGVQETHDGERCGE